MKIVHQRDWKDCGICSLKSIVEYYGGSVSLERLRLDAKVTQNGTTALNLILASKKYGFDAVGLKCESISDIHLLPAIVHLNLRNGMMHYVVLYKVTKDKVVLMDPAKGKVVKKLEDFNAEWSRVALVFYPKGKIAVLKNNNTLFNLIINIIKQEKKLFITITLLSVFLTIFTIAGGYHFQVMADAISSNYTSGYLIVIGLAFLSFLIFKLLLTYFRKTLENHLNKNIDVELNSDFLNHLYKLPLEVITSRTPGEVITRVSELTNIKTLVTDITVNVSLDMLLMIISIPLLISISWKLFLVLFFSILAYLLIGVISNKIIYKRVYQNIEFEEEYKNVLLEDINMINSIKNLCVVPNRLKRLEKYLSNYLYDNYTLNNCLNILANLKNVIYEVCIFVVNSLGFYLVYTEKLDYLSLITFNMFLGMFFDPLKKLIDSIPKFNYFKASIEKVNDFLSIDKEPVGSASNLTDNSIVIKNLRYSYNELDYILDDVNITINSKEFVLLSGPSGCGKSTICKILDKYITNYDGSVVIGNTNIKDLSISTIRKNIRYVGQNEAIFTGSIKDNILLDRKIDQKKFNEVCNICMLEDIVSKKRLRYETTINNDADCISGGEKQRIILARALMQDAKILILDEALAEVDITKEEAIMKNIRLKYPELTIIYVTHKKINNMFDRVIEVAHV